MIRSMVALVALSFTEGAQEVEVLDAVKAGNIELVQAIVSADSSQLAVVDTVGYSALHIAAAYGEWEILRWLVEAGADVNSRALDHTTPLHAASVYDAPEVIEMLLDEGAGRSLGVRDLYGGYTPLLRAAQSGALQVASLLLRSGADPSAGTKEGWTALHLAALGGHPSLFDALLERGVPGDVLDHEGRRYLECLLVRPEEAPLDSIRLDEFVGDFGPFVRVFRKGNQLWLDDHTLDALIPVGKDSFFCERNPWKVVFRRNAEGAVDSVELTFLRRSVVVEKTNKVEVPCRPTSTLLLSSSLR